MSKNRLESEKSAYLLQHKNNPVHWWSYSQEAIDEAKKLNRPIFLSIGYSTCHWCHVMSEESFDDQETAEYLNDNFICIKVDREEYPDLDEYYQKACQIFSKGGGWPLSAFLLPDLSPYFAGTYFPKMAREGISSFQEILSELNRVYKEDNLRVVENAKEASKTICQNTLPEKVDFPGNLPHPNNFFQALENYKDTKWGGWGGRPRFPILPFMEWSVEQVLEQVLEKNYAEHIIDSAAKFLAGGVYDHARGGIHRYSTDQEWLIPHFEKMLYDQSGLLRVLAKLSICYPTGSVIDGLEQTLDYLKAEMIGEHFFSAQDADSEGVEGLYQTFTVEEVEDLINTCFQDKADEMKNKIMSWHRFKKEGNYEDGLNVVAFNTEKQEEYLLQENWEDIRKFRNALLENRQQRIPPKTDTKGIASWNFLLLSSLVDVSQYCPFDHIKQKASNLLNEGLQKVFNTFIVKSNEGEEFVKIRHCTTQEESLPYLEDYVSFAELNLRIYEISGNDSFINNSFNAIDIIFKEFYKDGKLYSRANSQNSLELPPNLAQGPFDSSFRSSLSSFVLLLRRISLLKDNPEIDPRLDSLSEIIKNEILKNPLGAGEGLRALTYPTEVYRVLKVPKTWLQESGFVQLLVHLPNRFVISYHKPDGPEEKTNEWSLCSYKECQAKGHGLDSLAKTLTPAQDENSDES